MTDTKFDLFLLVFFVSCLLCVGLYMWYSIATLTVSADYKDHTPEYNLIKTIEGRHLVNTYDFDLTPECISGRTVPPPFRYGKPVFIDSIINLLNTKNVLCDTFIINQNIIKYDIINDSIRLYRSTYPIPYIATFKENKKQLEVRQYIDIYYLRTHGGGFIK